MKKNNNKQEEMLDEILSVLSSQKVECVSSEELDFISDFLKSEVIPFEEVEK